MAKKRIRACWLLLLVLLFVSSIMLSVGVTQARYQNTDTAAAVMKPPAGVSSNCLVTEQDAPRTVLLGQMDLNGSVCLPFWLISSGGDATQKLNWGVSNPQHAEYLDVSVFAGLEALEPNAELELLEDMKMDLLLCLEPTEKACNTLHERMKINVHVTWGDEMWGTFQVILPEVVEKIDLNQFVPYFPEPEAEAPTQPVTEPESEETTEPSTEPESEETTEPSTEPESEETTEPSTEPESEETTEPSAEPESEETTTPSTAPGTEEENEPVAVLAMEFSPVFAAERMTVFATEPLVPLAADRPTEFATEFLAELSTEPPTDSTTEPPTDSTTEAPTDPTTEPQTDSTTEPPTDPTTEPQTNPTTEPQTNPTTEPQTNPTIEPPTAPPTEPSTEHPTGPTPKPVETEEKENLIRTLPSFHPSERVPVLIELPKFVTGIRLGVLTVKEEKTNFDPFPDYTMFSLDGGASYYMLYGGYIPEFVLEKVTTVPVLLDFTFAQLDCSYIDSDENEVMALAMETYVGGALSKTYAQVISINAEQSDQMTFRPQDQQNADTKLLGPVLTFENTLEFTFPIEWEEAELNYSVEYLTMTDDQMLQYVPVTLTQDGLDAAYISTQYVHKLVLRLGDQFTAPGTYRINMSWTYEDICFMNKQTTFFINGSALMDGVMSSQEVPNDN